jgi:O-antigen ligase
LFTRSEVYFIAAIILTSVLLSSSRNCLGSILVFLFFIRFYKISYYYGFIIVIISAIIFQFINENLISIINSLGLGEYMRVEHLDDGSGRIVAWAFAWAEIQRNFFIGQGFGYDKQYFAAHREFLMSLGHQGGVHNSYLTVWLNTGLIGLILFLVAYIRMFIKAASINYLAIPTMFAIMFSISFESWASSSLSPFTVIFLLIITLLQYDKNENPAEENLVPVQ